MSKTNYQSASVIIPTYNESDYLLPCLEALHNQTVPPDEIIVVDNNTSDNSVARARKQFPDVIYLDEPRQGIVFARETGFNRATSDVIIKIDADTMVDPSWLEQLMRSMNEQQADAWSGYMYCAEIHPRTRPLLEYVSNRLLFLGSYLVTGHRFLSGSNLAMTKQAWRLIRNQVHMRNDIWEDMDMTVLLAKHKQKIITTTEQTAGVSARAANTTAKKFYIRLYGQSRVLALHGRWFSYALCLIYVQVVFATWIVSTPIAHIGQKWTTRTRPEQV